jgi:hypothetical protein
MPKKILKLVLIVVILGLFSACSGRGSGNSAYYLVDPRFSELYDRLQGEDGLGPPISNKKYLAGTNLEKQYFEGVVMVFDPDASPRYYLEAVGRDAGFSDLPNNSPENSSAKYINGFIIPLEFSQFYDQMGGERWVGVPLTRARLNPEKNTIEQYFENMGFFRFVDDAPGVVHLMPYGLWKCAGECAKYPGLENAGISSTTSEEIPSPFGEAIARFGTQFTGNTVSGAFRAEDGTIEQIFQNVVLYQDSSSPLGVSLRPVSSLLDDHGEEYQSRQENPQDYFREIKDGNGFYIPGYFMDFIDRYYGFVISGEPISRLNEIREGVFQQCFQNYCLLYDAKADQGQQVRLLPQGQKYRDTFQKNASRSTNQPAIRKRDIQLDIWEQLPQISSQESQQIGACVHESGSPLINALAIATIKISEAGSSVYEFDPTDGGGCSFLILDPIQAENGTTIDYQVCFQGLGDHEYCQRDSFLIWGNSDNNLASEPAAPQPANPSSEGQVVLDTWELHPQISSSESQEIGACIHEGNQPLADLNARLMLETPSEGVLTYQTAPTDSGGCSFFSLEAVRANNGQTIAYQVCFTNKFGEDNCKRDSFLIWGNP